MRGSTLLWGLLATGCVSARPEVVGSSYLAQSAVVSCKPGESSVVCCIKKWGPESCGVGAAEAAGLLDGARVLNEAAQADSEDVAASADAGWKQHCMDTYVACKNQKGWEGDCYECFRNCEGQREWPFHLCSRRGKVR